MVIKELIEIKAPEQSEAEKRKLEELKQLKKANTLKKSQPKAEDIDQLPKLKADALPPVSM